LLDRRGRGPASLAGRALAVGLSAFAVFLATVHPTRAENCSSAAAAAPRVAKIAAAPIAMAQPAVAAVPAEVAEVAEVADVAEPVELEAPVAHVVPVNVVSPVAPVEIVKPVENKKPAALAKLLAKLGEKTLRHRGEHYAKGMDLHRRGRYQEAIAEFEKAIDEGQREGAATYNIACGYARMGDSNRAFQWLERAIDA